MNASSLIPKPKYNTRYLISKGNKMTRNNRNKVRIQQLRNYINSSKNPKGIEVARGQINSLTRTRRRKN
jgi:hypothetical protein